MTSSDEVGPLPTSWVRAQSFDEAGWAVRTLSDGSRVGRRHVGTAITLCLGALLVVVGGQLVSPVMAIPFVVFLMVLLGLVSASIFEGAEPVFRRIRLDRRRLAIDEIRGDWTLHEDELLLAEGSNARVVTYDHLVAARYTDPILTIDRSSGEAWTVDWLPPVMAREIVSHLERVAQQQGDEEEAARRRAELGQLTKAPEREGGSGGGP